MTEERKKTLDRLTSRLGDIAENLDSTDMFIAGEAIRKAADAIDSLVAELSDAQAKLARVEKLAARWHAASDYTTFMLAALELRAALAKEDKA